MVFIKYIARPSFDELFLSVCLKLYSCVGRAVTRSPPQRQVSRSNLWRVKLDTGLAIIGHHGDAFSKKAVLLASAMA